MPPTPAPFILFDDARVEGAAPSRLYRDPVEVLTAWNRDELAAVLARLEAARADGLHAAGYFAYEAGYALEPRLRGLLDALEPVRLCWFGLFEGYEESPPLVSFRHPREGGGPAFRSAGRKAKRDTRLRGYDEIQSLFPATTSHEYLTAFDAIKSAIIAGDIYQANLTFPLTGSFDGDPMALYAALRQRTAAGYGGVLFDGQDWLLSLSPELFFTLRDGRITVRPMKGTVARGSFPEADSAAKSALAANPKDRAENLMIVDLMRNDISRVAVPGSVAVPDLFAIETYPNIHQMTSTITATLQPGLGAVDVIRAIFPCGSITGAPKIRAMEILHGLEHRPRGPYCGAMGRIDANGDAAFNVAIRTIAVQPRLNGATKMLAMGLGSAIVADSIGADEWRECHLKGAFLQELALPFDLIETMAFAPDTGVARLEAHLARMKDSAATLGFEFDRHATRNAIQAACFHADVPAKLRLMLSRSGATAIEMRPLPAPIAPFAKVAIVPLPVDDTDPRLRHKTSDRAFYDDARTAIHGVDEVVFATPAGHLTEGSFTHIYVEHGGILLTPPFQRGLLPGILRAELLESGKAQEADLMAADLAGGFFIGNSLRGLIPAQLVTA